MALDLVHTAWTFVWLIVFDGIVFVLCAFSHAQMQTHLCLCCEGFNIFALFGSITPKWLLICVVLF